MSEVKDQKVALITGGNRGLGRADALALGATGVDVILTYRSGKDEAAQVVAEIEAQGRKAVALQLDTSVVSEFPNFVAQIRDVLASTWDREIFDILVNNAGFAHIAPFEETTEEQFDDLVGVHFKGVFFLTQSLLPLIADGGSIINYSTGLTRFVVPGSAAYAAMKGAIEILTKYQAKELGARGIRVNVVAPGPIATDFAGGMMKSDEARSYLASQTALSRAGEAEDVGDAIASLASDASRWITAQRIEVSGGANL
ncbi:SDR family NAD(P)-dependent oxidoreductase [Streptosporangium sp. 'caverna']|jgi:NAD(P)-dependent dehydrogenase (short-subunit alcohol dehydrogenase family)|uniref:SDR family NAD(P)-dependent oxidoreductase n=1 Tax=Streptosporangium sp. 'caverna' TaxID=2202249 RepID=UPI000D7EB60E|nr:SDR family oxidoreductase [Streptosporangium sp. 'caverna']AWS47900.1 short-chain dehydrogenase [Streptosporangium sp. 'caverna']